MKVTSALKCSAAMALITWLFPAAAFPQYVRTDLTSDQPGVAANTSPHLVNGWGLVQLGTSPFWISDNGTGLSTLYNGRHGVCTALARVVPRHGTDQPFGNSYVNPKKSFERRFVSGGLFPETSRQEPGPSRV
jgi:hypothetical protein